MTTLENHPEKNIIRAQLRQNVLLKDLNEADRTELEEMVRPTGFYRNKANSLIRLGQELVERFDGEVPSTMAELVTLPGVGRKTANVILGNAFDIPGITVDTHFGRLVRRWRWTELEDPVKVEHAVGELIERREWTLLSHRVISTGAASAMPASLRAGCACWPRTAPPSGKGRRIRSLPPLWSRVQKPHICWRWPACSRPA